MEADNKGKEKRSRIDKEFNAGKSKKVRQEEQQDATEEEVEEFFAILRRMQVAVKYFEKENREGWRAALETEVVAVDGSGCDGEDKNDETKIMTGKPEKRPSAAEETRVLDLNAMPEVDTNDM